jgi:predicted amidophosphoribosyltransferase
MKECDPDYIYERNLLSWNRKVTQQSLIENKEDRQRNIKGALIVTYPELIKGKTIVVIDDVCTTGATLYEAQRALLDSGARKVILLTIAH